VEIDPMKKTLLAVGIALAAVLAGCNSDGTAKPTASAGPAKAYPLDVCVVSGEKLGSMGKPVEFEYQGQQIKLCCKNCKPDFDKEPAKYIGKLSAK